MATLTNAWFADHAPGKGRTILVAEGTAGVTNIIGHGNGWAPYTLAPPGDTIPVDGSTSPVGGLTFAQIMAVFSNATGFAGSEMLSDLPAASTANGTMSLSCWVNFGVTTVVGFNPIANQGSFFNINAVDPNVGTTASNRVALLPGTAGVFSPDGPDTSDLATDQHGGYTFPLDSTTNAGWVHLMMSARQTITGADTYTLHSMCYINDTEVYDTTQTGLSLIKVGPYYWPGVSGTNTNIGAAWGASVAPSGDGLYGAVAEYWFNNSFVDWSVNANRALFHVKSLALSYYAPCSLGGAGQDPLGAKPLIYLRGGPSLFYKNQARGGHALTVSGTLVAIDDPPDPPA